MPLLLSMQKVINALGRFIDMVGYFAAGLLLLMMLNIFTDVVMRYFFKNVNIGMQELEWHLYGAMFMFGIGYTLKEDAHVRVDVIYDRLSVKKKAWINIIGAVLFTIPFSVIMVYYGFGFTYEAFEMGEGSADPGGLPYRWIIRSVIPVSFVYLLVCLVHVILVQIQILRLPDNKDVGS